MKSIKFSKAANEHKHAIAKLLYSDDKAFVPITPLLGFDASEFYYATASDVHRDEIRPLDVPMGLLGDKRQVYAVGEARVENLHRDLFRVGFQVVPRFHRPTPSMHRGAFPPGTASRIEN
jgi:hypothetical protein